MEKKLFKHKSFKINGVKFTVQKLNPGLFMDKDYVFPMTSVVEKSDKEIRELSESDITKTVEQYKDKMRDTILRGVVCVKSGVFAKKRQVKDLIDKIMENPELYSALFSVIVTHSLGVKKKLLHHFKLTEVTPKQFI